jgi:hypothetical protein
MTKGTRQRLYTRAETSQARLTVTAVAETFAQAYSERLISDATFDAMVTQGTIGPITASGSTTVPGMTSATDNRTMLTVTSGGTDVYYFDFTTTIGSESESVRLTYNKRGGSGSAGSFQHQLRLGTGGRLENVNVGSEIKSTGTGVSTDRVDNPNNTVLSLGNAASPNGQMHMCSTLYSSAPIGGGSNWQCYSDVILFGANAGFDLNGSSGSTFNGNDGADVYFLNCGSFVWCGSTALTDQTSFDSQSSNFSLTDWLHGFNNAVFQDTPVFFNNNNNFQNVGHVYINDMSNFEYNSNNDAHIWDSNTGDWTSDWSNKYDDNWATVSGAAASYLKIIQDNHYDNQALSTEPRTYSDFINQDAIKDNNILKSNPKTCGASSMNLVSAGGGNYTLAPGDYVLGNAELNIGSGKRITCNLDDGTYVFYVRGDYTFKTGIFEFINGDVTDATKTAYFVICDDASLRFDSKAGNNNNVATGIISANCHGGQATNVSDYQRNTISQSSKPCVMVIGAGCSVAARQVPVSDGQIYYKADSTAIAALEAYVNLLPLDVSSPSEELKYGSVFSSIDGDGLIYYGRMYAREINGGTGNCMVIPYCPAPNDDIDDGPDYDLSKYVLKDFSYFH